MSVEFKLVKERKPQITRPRFRRSQGGVQKSEIGCQVDLISPNFSQTISSQSKYMDFITNTQPSQNHQFIQNQDHLDFNMQCNYLPSHGQSRNSEAKFFDSRKFRSFRLQRNKRTPFQTVKSPRFQRNSFQNSQNSYRTKSNESLLASLLFSNSGRKSSNKENQNQFVIKGAYQIELLNNSNFDESEILLDGYTPRQSQIPFNQQDYIRMQNLFQKKTLQSSNNQNKNSKGKKQNGQISGNKSIESSFMTQDYQSFLYSSN